MSLKPRPEIEKLEPCVHGGLGYSLELKSVQVIDFSVNSNPFPVPQAVRDALNKASLEQYPDSSSTELRNHLAVKLDIKPENIIVGSGTTELIRLVTLTYLSKDDTALIIEPTYGEYEIACRISGSRVIKYRSKPENSFALDLNKLVGLIKSTLPKIIFICNPNNPTGRYLSKKDISQIRATSGNSLLVIDEAYLAFAERSWSSIPLILRGNVILLRSMTKDFALAGLRLGHAIAPAEIIANLKRVCPPWNVNSLAQQAGIAALENDSYLPDCLYEIRKAKKYLISELSLMGFEVMPSSVNYFLIKVKNGARFRSALLGYGIVVRDCASFGLPGYVRIGVRTLPECKKFIEIVDKILKEGIYNGI